jgi:hypothetical protein
MQLPYQIKPGHWGRTLLSHSKDQNTVILE